MHDKVKKIIHDGAQRFSCKILTESCNLLPFVHCSFIYISIFRSHSDMSSTPHITARDEYPQTARAALARGHPCPLPDDLCQPNACGRLHQGLFVCAYLRCVYVCVAKND